MSREVRRVPLTYQHPTEWVQRYDRHTRKLGPVIAFKPLFKHESYAESVRDHQQEVKNYGEVEAGPTPNPEDYMPDFTDTPEDNLGWCMYETTSEGTPISPVLKDQDALAHWLAENGASAFGGEPASYERWKAMINAGHSVCSAVVMNGRIVSGVDAVTTMKELTNHPGSEEEQKGGHSG